MPSVVKKAWCNAIFLIPSGKQMSNNYESRFKKVDFVVGFPYIELLWGNISPFGYVEKRLDKKVKVNSKICDVIDWATDNYNTHAAQYLKI